MEVSSDFAFFYGLYSQKIKTLKNFKIKSKENLSWKRKFPQEDFKDQSSVAAAKKGKKIQIQEESNWRHQQQEAKIIDQLLFYFYFLLLFFFCINQFLLIFKIKFLLPNENHKKLPAIAYGIDQIQQNESNRPKL